MRVHRSYWRMLIGMLGSMIILVACGGGSANSTTGTNGAYSRHATVVQEMMRQNGGGKLRIVNDTSPPRARGGEVSLIVV